ncbi:MAG: hypothetical protein P4M05_10945 [Bradyrhizobium sp.]|nr:hypothetical protein [Bradyrhizobium sp.]
MLSRRALLQTTVALAATTAIAKTKAVEAATAPMAIPASVAKPVDPHPWKWWVSLDGGDVYHNACATREEALEIARGYGTNAIYGTTAIIAECKQQDFRTDIDGDRILEWLQESNEELIGEGEYIDCSAEQLKDLEDSVEATIRAWVERHKINNTAWMFGDVRNKEIVSALPRQEGAPA